MDRPPKASPPRSYDAIKRRLDTMRPQDTVEIPVDEFGPPMASWVRTTLGIPYVDTKRQWRDGVYHIHLTRKGTYRFHRDQFDPKIHPVRHMVYDATRTLTFLALGTGLGLGLVGRVLRRRLRGM